MVRLIHRLKAGLDIINFAREYFLDAIKSRCVVNRLKLRIDNFVLVRHRRCH